MKKYVKELGKATALLGSTWLAVQLVDYAAKIRVGDYTSWMWIFVPALVYFCINFRTKIYQFKDSEVCWDKSVYVINSKDELKKYLYEDADSVVKGAMKKLYVTGSRSSDREYLGEIEKKLSKKTDISHIRVLFGPPKTPEINDHIKKIREIIQNRSKIVGSSKVEVKEYSLDVDDPERFVVCNEKRAVVIIPSLSTVRGYDTALVIDNLEACQKLCNVVESLAQASKSA